MMEIIGFGTAVWKLEVTHMEHNISWRTIMASSPAQSAKLVYRSLPSSVVAQRPRDPAVPQTKSNGYLLHLQW